MFVIEHRETVVPMYCRVQWRVLKRTKESAPRSAVFLSTVWRVCIARKTTNESLLNTVSVFYCNPPSPHL